jgi:hypothetical protein
MAQRSGMARLANPPDQADWFGAEASPLPTPRSILAAQYLRLRLTCRVCSHRTTADLQGLADGGRGDVPVKELRFRCGWCGSRQVDRVVASERIGPR